MRTAIRWGMAGLMAASLVGGTSLTSVAHAAGLRGGGVNTSGKCSVNSTWRLALRPEDPNLLRVSFKVREDVIGDTWTVIIKDNGTTIFSKDKTTVAPDGRFTANKKTADQPGTDNVTASATNQRTGETCQGSASL